MSKTREAFDAVWRDDVRRERLISRFWAGIDRAPGHGPKGDCWFWKRSKTTRPVGLGYGTTSFIVDGKQSPVYIHVLSYRIHKGNHPKDRPHTLHKCDWPPCGNPEHLFAGNAWINNLDMCLKGRYRGRKGTGKPRAVPERTWRVRLTSEQVSIIQARRKAKGANVYDMGFMLGMDYTRYYRLENDMPTCTLEQMHFLLRYLDISEESFNLTSDQYYQRGLIGKVTGRKVVHQQPTRVYRKNSPVAVERRHHAVWKQFANPRTDLFRADLIQDELKATYKQLGLIIKESGISRTSLYSLLNGHLTDKNEKYLPTLIEYTGLKPEQVMCQRIAA